MRPIDYRNDTWQSIQSRISGDRRSVLYALRHHGPCTTRQLAAAMGRDILCVSPRVTELLQLGFACLTDDDTPGKEGHYRALSDQEALQHFTAAQHDVLYPIQLDLKITT